MLFARESGNQTGKGSLPNIIRPLRFQFLTNSACTADPCDPWRQFRGRLLLQKPVALTLNFSRIRYCVDMVGGETTGNFSKYADEGQLTFIRRRKPIHDALCNNFSDPWGPRFP